MKIGESHKIEFIAKTIADLGKGIFIVSLASNFFEKFQLVWRVSFIVGSMLLMCLGIFIYPEKGGKEGWNG
jgi:hypothetical protein